jgi:hypothetical protein
LGEQSGTPRFIMNVRGRGYQFVPEVVRLDETVRSNAPTCATDTAYALPTHNSAAWQCYQQAIFLTGMDNPTQWSAAVDVLTRAIDLAQSLRHQILSWYTELGALDKAYVVANDMLDHLGRHGIVGMTWSGLWLREMRAFRRDRRFEPFAARLGLTDYWNRFGPADEFH